jgi:phospholipase/carboxylesterase
LDETTFSPIGFGPLFFPASFPLSIEYPDELKFKLFESATEAGNCDCLISLCHGYGATGDDLVPIAEQICAFFQQKQPDKSIRFVVPAAPLSLSDIPYYDARAWWPLNMERLAAAMQTSSFAELHASSPEGLEQAAALLRTLIDLQLKELQLGYDRLIVAGFSQGAMLSTEVALQIPENVGGLCIFSGTLIRQEIWKKLAAAHAGLHIFQSHGTTDPILPVSSAKRLSELFQQTGAEITFEIFNGPHTIPNSAMTGLVEQIQRVVNR